LLVGLLAICVTCVLVLRGQSITNELLARGGAAPQRGFLAGTQRISKTGSFSFKSPSGEMYWSDEAARIYGYPLDLKPTMELLLAHTMPEDRGIVQARWSNAARRERVEVRHRLLMPDGELKYVHVLAGPRFYQEWRNRISRRADRCHGGGAGRSRRCTARRCSWRTPPA
jgi:PAS domain-containing protein